MTSPTSILGREMGKEPGACMVATGPPKVGDPTSSFMVEPEATERTKVKKRKEGESQIAYRVRRTIPGGLGRQGGGLCRRQVEIFQNAER